MKYAKYDFKQLPSDCSLFVRTLENRRTKDMRKSRPILVLIRHLRYTDLISPEDDRL